MKSFGLMKTFCSSGSRGRRKCS